ncbi:SDR family oxidoreductase [Mucilaginibacter sp. HC2]|uniref:SDR family oxidoreductase n=1 Tax=Mucilaginibacter inviolabilis TaxID=2714892 RepID=UPI00140BC019|nr:SDR family oxidoreductase [Mucilaginibacter inviolabilis]NHA04385.1 SDR family oxidoreductase [Mucilaginibacter inviolabilis]
MNKVILITGASSGIGKESAKYFAAKGWHVIATMRNPEKETELNTIDNILVTKLDVQDTSSIAHAIETGISHFGHIDALVNNAGYGQMGIFEAMSKEQVINQLEVNVFGVMDTVKAILPHFRERKQGTIVNVSSGAGKFTLPMLSMYSASKFALEGFSEALSFELSTLNIKVKIVEPGGTTTNFGKTSQDVFAAGIADYDPFLAAAGKMFDAMRNGLVTAEDVAALIYEAATDNTDTLRYVIGNDDFMLRMKAREEMADQDYMNLMRSSFEKHLS